MVLSTMLTRSNSRAWPAHTSIPRNVLGVTKDKKKYIAEVNRGVLRSTPNTDVALPGPLSVAVDLQALGCTRKALEGKQQLKTRQFVVADRPLMPVPYYYY